MEGSAVHPVVVVSHGPGPLWLLKSGAENRQSLPARNMASVLKRLYPRGAALPKRILLVSAHWETYRVGFEISRSPSPGMLYDYEGFPAEASELVYPAKGDADFAEEVAAALARSKIRVTPVLRAFDHAAFVPMALMRRQADIPVVTMSINWKLNTKAHLDLGRALAQFRDRDTLIVCSGQATHGMANTSELSADGISTDAEQFQGWLDEVLTNASELTFQQRQERLLAWETKAPFAAQAHPRPEHFMPFLVAAGAGMDKHKPEATKLFGGWGGSCLSYASYAWGLEGQDASVGNTPAPQVIQEHTPEHQHGEQQDRGAKSKSAKGKRRKTRGQP